MEINTKTILFIFSIAFLIFSLGYLFHGPQNTTNSISSSNNSDPATKNSKLDWTTVKSDKLDWISETSDISGRWFQLVDGIKFPYQIKQDGNKVRIHFSVLDLTCTCYGDINGRDVMTNTCLYNNNTRINSTMNLRLSDNGSILYGTHISPPDYESLEVKLFREN